MKLLYLTRVHSFHDQRFLQAYRRHGIQVRYLTLRDSAPILGRWPLPEGVEPPGSLVRHDGSSLEEFDVAAAGLAAAVARFAPDLVVAGPLTDCGYVAARAGLPCPWVLQSWAFDVFWENEQSATAAEGVRLALTRGPALFADCEAVVAQCERIANRAIPVRFVMPWGIDLAALAAVRAGGQRTREDVRRELQIEGRTVFLYTRGLEPVYSVLTLLQAWGDLSAQQPGAVLLMASGGSLRPAVEQFVRDHGMQHSVMLLGVKPHDQVLGLFCAADCYVSCAASDGTSISLLEAMAMGLPAIVSDIGGNREWIQPEQNGWVVPHNDSDRLAHAMNRAIGLAPGARLQLAEQNRHLLESKADWGGNFPRYLSFLRACARLH